LLKPAPELGTPVIAQNIEGKNDYGYVTRFMGNPKDKEGRYSILITFYQDQNSRYFTNGEEGSLWSKLPS
jgi:hypothetical protein